MNKICRQVIQIAVLSFAIIVLGRMIGIHLLSAMYQADLLVYKTEFVMLLIASSMYAYVGFFSIILTIMRKQKILSVVYALVAVGTVVVANLFVKKLGLLGAAYQNVFTMLIQAAILLGLIVGYIKDKRKKERCGC